MQLSDLTIEACDAARERRALVNGPDAEFEIAPVLNGVGTWKVRLSKAHPAASIFSQVGARILVTAYGEIIFSGVVTEEEVDASVDDPDGLSTFVGVSDEVHLWDRLCYPTPSEADVAAQTDEYYKVTGPAQDVITQIVLANLGPSAPVSRRLAEFTYRTPSGIGDKTTRSLRYEVVGEVIQAIAKANGLRFTLRQTTDRKLHFDCFTVVDRSGYIRFALRANTLSSYKMHRKVPTATHVIAGPGEADWDNSFSVVTNSTATAWSTASGRRIERFAQVNEVTVDWDATPGSPEAEADPLQPALDVLKEEGTITNEFQAIPLDDGDLRFLRDFHLGDVVSVVTGSSEFKVPITGFVLQANTEGVKMGVRLGEVTNPEATLRKSLNEDSVPPKYRTIPEEALDEGLRQRVDEALYQAHEAANFAEAATVAYRQPTAPPGGKKGDVWFDSDDNNHMYYHNGTAWVDAKDTFILDSSLGGKTITGSVFQTTATANRGIKFNSSGLYGWDSSGNLKFNLSASNGMLALTGPVLSGGDINGATITGATVQSSATSSRGIKFNDTHLIAYNSSGTPTLAITAATGQVTLQGGILTGGSITGSLIQTNDLSNRGIKLTSGALVAYDASGSTTFSLNASTGAISMTGGLISGGTITAPTFYTGNTSGQHIRFTQETDWLGGMRFMYGSTVVGSIQMVTFDSARSLVFHAKNYLQINGGNLRSSITMYQGGASGALSGIRVKSSDKVEISGDSGIELYGATDGQIYVKNLTTTTDASNTRVSSNGRLYMSTTSVRAAKAAIETIPDEQVRSLLDVPVVTWYDVGNAERLAEAIENEDEEFTDVEPLRRIPGVIAEDVYDAGASAFVEYTADDEVAGVKYERIGVAWIPLMRELYDRIEELESQVAALSE